MHEYHVVVEDKGIQHGQPEHQENREIDANESTACVLIVVVEKPEIVSVLPVLDNHVDYEHDEGVTYSHDSVPADHFVEHPRKAIQRAFLD